MMFFFGWLLFLLLVSPTTQAFTTPLSATRRPFLLSSSPSTTSLSWSSSSDCRRRRRHTSSLASSTDASSSSSSSSSSLSNTGFLKNETTTVLAQQQQEEDMTVLPNQTTAETTETSTTTPSTTPSTAPSYRELLIFTSTTMLIWLSEPLLSLVDTTVVGLTQGAASVTQLASLGPATTLLDSLLYLTYFLAICTTNQIAASRAVGNVRQLQQTTSHTLGLATFFGLVTTAIVWVWGTPLLRNMAGGAATPALVGYAVAYSRIRAAAAVPAVMGMVAQSVCLATLDTVTPAVAVVVASVLNIAGDVLLAPTLGVRGAAWATAASNVASTTVLLRAVQQQMRKWRQQEEQEQQQQQQQEQEQGDVKAASSPLPTIPMFSWPDRTSLLSLLGLVGPIFFVICAKIACYSAMTLRCTEFGVLPLAAHGIMMRLWFFFGCFGDSLSQTAQSYLPSTMYPTPRPHLFRKTLVRMLWIALGLGVLNSQMGSWILQFGGSLFTNDTAIMNLMKEHRFFITIAMLLHPFIMCLEGTVIAARDFKTLVSTYVVTLCLHFGILKWFCPSFPAIWRTFFLFQSIRLGNFCTHVWKKQRATKKNKNETNSLQEQTVAAAA